MAINQVAINQVTQDSLEIRTKLALSHALLLCAYLLFLLWVLADATWKYTWQRWRFGAGAEEEREQLCAEPSASVGLPPRQHTLSTDSLEEESSTRDHGAEWYSRAGEGDQGSRAARGACRGRSPQQVASVMACQILLYLSFGWLGIAARLVVTGSTKYWQVLAPQELLFSLAQGSGFLLAASTVVGRTRKGLLGFSTRLKVFLSINFLFCTYLAASAVARWTVAYPAVDSDLFWDDAMAVATWLPLTYLTASALLFNRTLPPGASSGEEKAGEAPSGGCAASTVPSASSSSLTEPLLRRERSGHGQVAPVEGLHSPPELTAIERTPFGTEGPIGRLFFLWLNPLLYKGSRKVLDFVDVPALLREHCARAAFERFNDSWTRLELARWRAAGSPQTCLSRLVGLCCPGSMADGDWPRTVGVQEDTADQNQPLLSDPEEASDSSAGTAAAAAAGALGEGVAEEALVMPYRGGKKPMLIWALLDAFWRPFFMAGLFILANACVTYAGPLILHTFVTYAESNRPKRKEGFVLVGLLFFAQMIETVSRHQYYFRCQLLGIRVRSALIAATYRKGLRLSSKARQDHSTGEIVNFMAVDAQRVADLLLQLHSLWVLPVQISVALVILFHVVGLSMLAGLGAMFAAMVVNFFIAGYQRSFQMKIMEHKDLRMKATSEALNNMRVIKLHAWEGHFLKAICTMRDLEWVWLEKYMYNAALSIFLLWSTTLFVSVATFTAMVLAGSGLTTARVFTAIATFRILQEPLRAFPSVIAAVAQALVSIDRLRDFFASSEIQPDAVRHLALAANLTQSNPEALPKHSVIIHQATFVHDEGMDAAPTLKSLDVRVRRGSLVAVVGPVGAGKSSLLACILGDMAKLKGSVTVRGSIAYSPQQAWIQNATVRDNILFGQPFSRSRYERALRACQLTKDLEQMPAGDRTEIGERGINLSGGQKQRVQLARAVYQDMDVYLLDDPFSAVDAHTGTDLFKECVAGALSSKTVVLVTHQVEFLPAADLILVMRDGEIVQEGRYEDLLDAGTDFSSLVNAHNSALEACEAQGSGGDPQSQPSNGNANGTGEDATAPSAAAAGVDKDRRRSFERPSSVRTESAQDQEEGARMIEQEERMSGTVGLAVYWDYINKAFNGLHVPVLILAQILWQALQISSDWWLATSTSAGKGHHIKPLPEPDRFLLVYAALALSSGLFVLVRSFTVALVGLRTTQAYFTGMMRAIFRAPMSFFDATPSGRILNRASMDQSVLDMELPFRYGSVLALVFQLLGILLVTAAVTWQMALLFVPVAIIYFMLQRFHMASSRELTRLDSIAKSPVIHHFAESIAGASVIRAFGRSERFAIASLRRIDASARINFHCIASNEWLGLRLEIIAASVLCATALCLALIPRDKVHAGYVGLSLSYGLSLNTCIFYVVMVFCQLENRMVSVERIQQYTNVPQEAPEVVEGKRPPEDWPSEGAIDFENLQMRYTERQPLVLRGITLSIRGGEKVGIVGRTGSGKSSLILALFRVVEPCGGRVLIDGLDTSEIGLYDLRSRIAIIPQDPTLFDGSVRSNLDPLSQHSDTEIWEVLESCQLAGIIREREEKLSCPVTEHGSNWSVGQRQLFCLGRALLSRARILVLDEATASVDAATDALVQATIRRSFGSSTVVSIAHRIPTVMGADRVLVLDQGRVAEFDAPSALMEARSSRFAGLVQEYSNRSNSVADLASLSRSQSAATLAG